MMRIARTMIPVTLCALCLLGICHTPAVAQTESPVEGAEEAEGENIKIFGLFLGATTKFKEESDNTYFTLALEYEYIKATWGPWGLAGVVEAIFGEKMEWILMPLAYYHFGTRWFLRSGLGLELGREDDEQNIKAHLIWRLGVGYSIPVKGFELVPSLDWDMVRTDPSLVYGLVIGKEF